MILFRNIILFFKDKSYKRLTVSTIIVLLNGTIVYHYAEGLKWLDSIYFSVITLTTVGYGDFAPRTDFGKIFTIVYVLTGIGIIFGFINAFYQKRISNMDNYRENVKKKLDL